MKRETKTKRNARHDTLRRAKRSGYRVYPAWNDGSDEIRQHLGDGNYRTPAAPNYDNV